MIVSSHAEYGLHATTGPQANMSGPMGYGYPNQYGGPMNGMGGNMRPAYGAPDGMPVCCCTSLA